MASLSSYSFVYERVVVWYISWLDTSVSLFWPVTDSKTEIDVAALNWVPHEHAYAYTTSVSINPQTTHPPLPGTPREFDLR